MDNEKRIEQAIYILQSKVWLFAKTAKDKNPHWYTLRSTFDDNDRFDNIVLLLREFGNEENFWNVKYLCLYHKGWKYWTMGSPVDETILINKTFASEQYNKIAYKYNDLFNDTDSVLENVEVINLFAEYLTDDKTLLDVGSGTGMILNYINRNSSNYIGIDPSYPMIKLSRELHPEFLNCFKYDKFETHHKKYDFIVSLFGSMNYVIDLYLDKIYDKLNKNGKYFLMFYKETYSPITYELTGVKLYHYKHNKEVLKRIFTDATITEFNNYYIVTNI